MNYAEIININNYVSIIFSLFYRKMFILDFLLNQFWNLARQTMLATSLKSIQKAMQVT